MHGRHTNETRRKISQTRRERIAAGLIQPWNKGTSGKQFPGKQVPWNKGLTKETSASVAKYAVAQLGHGMCRSARKVMSQKAKARCADGSWSRRIVSQRLRKWARTGNPQKGRHNHWCTGRNSPVFNGDNTRYKHLLYRGTYYRSTWEVAFARWCYAQKLEFMYEPHTFRLAPGPGRSFTYTPDFWLVESDVYVEIKGFLTPDKFQQMQAFKKQYPNKHLILAGKEMLQGVGVLSTVEAIR